MSWFVSVFVAFLTAVVGAFGTGVLGMLCADWFRVPNREGGSAYLVLFMGLLGGLLGLIIGLVCSRYVAAGSAPGFGRGLGLSAGVTLGLLVVATTICWLAADFDTKLHGRPVELHAEVRCPAGFVIPAETETEKWYACIGTASRRATSYGTLRIEEAKQVDGRWIIPMTVVLKTSVFKKEFFVSFTGKSEMFILMFPSKPGERYFTWSEWIDSGWEPVTSRPEIVEKFNLRYRLEVVPASIETPPGPSDAEVAAAKEAAEKAELAALSPESPLEECMKFTHYSQTEEVRAQAGAVIGRRPDVIAEISAQVLSPDPEVYSRALRAMGYIKPLPADLAGPVNQVAQKVVASLERFIASKPEDDPSYRAAGDAAALFTEWFQGHVALHNNAGVDGLPQLKKMLELSQRRSDSDAMNVHVTRIARHYVSEWSQGSAVAK